MNEIKNHWENIYSIKRDIEVSWFQDFPENSLSLIENYCFGDKEKSIADIGGDNSLLVSELVKLGYSKFCVLDISGKAIVLS